MPHSPGPAEVSHQLLGRESYFLAAYALLGEQGSVGMTVAGLCERVEATKGSFYHHFGDLPEFVEAFAARWRTWMYGLFDTYLAETDLMRRVEMMLNSHIVAIVGAEPRIRAWGRTDPVIAAALAKVDAHGDRLCATTFAAIVGDAETGTVLARYQAALALPWPATSAWQNWGWTNPVIAASLLGAERRAEQGAAAAVAELLDDAEKAVLVGQMGMGMALGMQTRYPPMDLHEFATVGMEWARRCIGLDAELVHDGGMPQIRLARRSGPGTPPSVRREALT
jgi:AcrR family transcriptional regulator